MSHNNKQPVIDTKEVIASKPKQRRRLVDFRHVLVLIALSFGVLSVLAKLNPYFPIDLSITRTIQQIQIPLFPEFMKFISTLGNVGWGVFSVAVFMVLAFLMKRKKDALFILVSVTGTSLIGMAMKLIVGRPRPAEELLLNFPGYLKDNSFPSGHVLFYMGLYGFLLFLFYSQLKDIALRTVLMGVCIFLLVCIGISRIYLGAHWFSDTLGSYLIGTVWLYIVVRLYKKFTLL